MKENLEQSTRTIAVDAIQKNLIDKARDIFREIAPCGKSRSIEECFTIYGNHLVFWFNTNDGSTHIVSTQISLDGPVRCENVANKSIAD